MSEMKDCLEGARFVCAPSARSLVYAWKGDLCLGYIDTEGLCPENAGSDDEDYRKVAADVAARLTSSAADKARVKELEGENERLRACLAGKAHVPPRAVVVPWRTIERIEHPTHIPVAWISGWGWTVHGEVRIEAGDSGDWEFNDDEVDIAELNRRLCAALGVEGA